jgi:triosephosphate isomerase
MVRIPVTCRRACCATSDAVTYSSAIRSAAHHEDDDLVARKTRHVLSEGILSIVCVGKTWEERGYGRTHSVLTRQIRAVAAVLAKEQLARLVVAYEPVWAIGTGMTATPSVAQECHATIRHVLAEFCPEAAERVHILYGGSMKADNAGDLLGMPDIDVDQFLSIVAEATPVSAPLV